MPSTCLFKDKKYETEPKAKVKYHLKAELKFEDDDHEWKYKQILMIREKPLKEQEEFKKKDTADVTSWCCIGQGQATLEAEFEKNSF